MGGSRQVGGYQAVRYIEFMPCPGYCYIEQVNFFVEFCLVRRLLLRLRFFDDPVQFLFRDKIIDQVYRIIFHALGTVYGGEDHFGFQPVFIPRMQVFQIFQDAGDLVAVFIHNFHHHAELCILRGFNIFFQLIHGIHGADEFVPYPVATAIIQTQYIIQRSPFIRIGIRMNIAFEVNMFDFPVIRNIVNGIQ